jgi:hypothetical protein
MAKYERANEKSGRLFVTEQERLADNPKLPVLNGSIMVDGVLMYLGLWKRISKSGSAYYTAELTYPNDEEARLKATGPATSAAAKKERDYDKTHPKSKAHDSGRWQSRSQDEAEDTGNDEDLPF